MQQNRNPYIDFLKGAGILLVVFGHLTSYGQPWREWIYGFHMPLFFMLSGLFVSDKDAFPAFFQKKFRSLYIPFAFFITIDIVISFLTQLKTEQLSQCLISAMTSLPKYLGLRFYTRNGPVWFLFVLFILQILLYFLQRTRYILYACTALSAALTVILSHFGFPEQNLWFNVIPAFAFFAVGFLFKKQILMLPPAEICSRRKIWMLLPLAILVVPYAFSADFNDNVDIIWHCYGNSIALFYLNAFSGCILFTILCAVPYALPRLRKIVIWFGKNSVYILVTHYYITKFGVAQLLKKAALIEYRFMPWMQVILFFGVVLCMVPVVYLCKRFLYPVFGIKATPHKSRRTPCLNLFPSCCTKIS